MDRCLGEEELFVRIGMMLPVNRGERVRCFRAVLLIFAENRGRRILARADRGQTDSVFLLCHGIGQAHGHGGTIRGHWDLGRK